MGIQNGDPASAINDVSRGGVVVGLKAGLHIGHANRLFKFMDVKNLSLQNNLPLILIGFYYQTSGYMNQVLRTSRGVPVNRWILLA